MVQTAAELKRKRTGFRKIESIVIDPGHGGPDYGIVKGEYKEKSVLLDIGKKVNLLARKNKFSSSLTRASDHFISLDDRTEKISLLRSYVSTCGPMMSSGCFRYA